MLTQDGDVLVVLPHTLIARGRGLGLYAHALLTRAIVSIGCEKLLQSEASVEHVVVSIFVLYVCGCASRDMSVTFLLYYKIINNKYNVEFN